MVWSGMSSQNSLLRVREIMTTRFAEGPSGQMWPTIKQHSLEKLRRHNYFASIFAKAMRNQFENLVYIGLYSGAGRAILDPTGELVDTSALSVLTQEVPFTKYIFVDSDERCIERLRVEIELLDRTLDVTLIQDDVNDSADAVIRALPSFSPPKSGLLGLCFVDPYKGDFDFDVIRKLSRFKIDFLMMLPFGHDIRRNRARYLEDRENQRIGRLIGNRSWREKFQKAGGTEKQLIPFLFDELDDRMAELRYGRRDLGEIVNVKVSGMGVYLYSLVFYSGHPLGSRFWKATVKGTTEQGDLFHG